jgi:hypothetical protein
MTALMIGDIGDACNMVGDMPWHQDFFVHAWGNLG